MLPSPRLADAPTSWDPFDDELQFRLGDFLYRKVEMSGGNIDELMDIWASTKMEIEDFSPFDSHEHMYATIDAITHGDAPWKTFTTSYAGEIGPNPPSWQLHEYQVWYRDPSVVAKNMLDNPDFDQQMDYAPYVELDASGQRCWSEFMSGNYSWRHSVCFLLTSILISMLTQPQNDIFNNDPSTEGAMYCPIILGADKTTVSVATGHVEYHPLYFSVGGIHNTVRRGHRNAVVPIGFLAIPKSM